MPRKIIKDFQVFGERRSGTNYVRALIAKNLKVKHVTHYGWKHGPPTMPAISKHSLIVLVARDPIDWIQSFYVTPHEAAEHLRVEQTFSEFIRAEWAGLALPGMQGWEKWGHQQNMELRGEELQWDRHPMTGARYKNVLEMRAVKYRAWLGLRERAAKFALVRYEDARDAPETVVEQLADEFLIDRKPDFDPIDQRMGNYSLFPDGFRERPKEISAKDRRYIADQLEPEIEEKLGYSQMLNAGAF